MKNFLWVIGFAVMIAGFLVMKTNEAAGYIIAGIGVCLFFVGIAITKSKKISNKDVDTSAVIVPPSPPCEKADKTLLVEVEKNNNKDLTKEREAQQKTYTEILKDAKPIYYCKNYQYGVGGDIVMRDEKTGTYYKVTEKATGRGIGFPPSEPEMVIASPPEIIFFEQLDPECQYSIFFNTDTLFLFHISQEDIYKHQHYICVDKRSVIQKETLVFYEVHAVATGRQNANHEPIFVFDKQPEMCSYTKAKQIAEECGISDFEKFLEESFHYYGL